MIKVESEILIQIAFKEVENGKPVNFWFSPIQHKYKLNYDEAGTEICQISQVVRLGALQYRSDKSAFIFLVWALTGGSYFRLKIV